MQNPAVSNITDRPIPSFFDVADLRLQVNLFGDTTQDNYLQMLCAVGQEQIEDYIGQYLETTSTECYYQRFDTSGMRLPQPNVTNVVVQYWDVNDVLQTLSPSTYFVDTTVIPVMVKPVLNGTFPAQTSSTRTNPVKISYDSILYGAQNDMDIERINHAFKLIATHWYNNRSDTDVANKKEIPYGFLRLLNKYRTATL